jgi:hypothetical protein
MRRLLCRTMQSDGGASSSGPALQMTQGRVASHWHVRLRRLAGQCQIGEYRESTPPGRGLVHVLTIAPVTFRRSAGGGEAARLLPVRLQNMDTVEADLAGDRAQALGQRVSSKISDRLAENGLRLSIHHQLGGNVAGAGFLQSAERCSQARSRGCHRQYVRTG